MKLLQLTLSNFKQFKDVEISFTGNLICLLGKNGAGKSNFIKSLQFIFTGEVPGENKANLIRWNSTSGYVKLSFIEGGVTYVIKRELATSEASIRSTTKGVNFNVEGATKVNEVMQQWLDKDIARQAVFVRQAEIDSALFTEPRVRKLAFQRLCGVDCAQKIFTKVSDAIGRIPVIYDYADQIEDANKQKQLLEADLKDLEAALQTVTGVINNKTVASLQNILADIIRIRDLYIRRNDTIRQIGKLEQDVVNLKKELDAVSASTDLTVDEKFLLEQINDLKNAMAANQKYLQQTREWSEFKTSLDNMREDFKTLPDIASLDTQISSLNTDSQVTSNTIRAADKVLAVFSVASTGCTCPLCGNIISNVEIIVNSKKKEIDEAKLKLTSIDDALLALNKQRQAAYTRKCKLETSISNTAASVDFLSKELANNVNKLTLPEPEIRERIAAINATYAKLSTSKKRFTELTQAIAQTVSTQQTIQQALAQTDIAIAQLNIKESLEELDHIERNVKTEIDELIATTKKESELIGNIKAIKQSIKNLEASINEFIVKNSRLDEHRNTIKVLEDVKAWFHYSSGPHRVAALYLSKLVDDINNYLTTFSAAFQVIPDLENLGFKVNFIDGRVAPASGYSPAEDLSGGQKIVLALSFRFANYKLFSSKLGLLVLDEPTAYLDDASISNFCSVIETIKGIITNMGVQVFMATHEKSIVQFCDQLINIEELV